MRATILPFALALDGMLYAVSTSVGVIVPEGGELPPWPACARAIYRGAVELRNAEWMIHAHACGLMTRQRICLQLVPHLRPLLLPQFLICVPAFVVAEANLGALGLGVGEPMPSWGAMLLELDNSALLARSHWVYLPIALLVLVLLLLESFTSEMETHA